MSKKQKQKTYCIKMILLGESGVGKTNLINVFLGLQFEDYTETNNASSFEGKIDYQGKIYIEQ